jgi:hypothetical protein
MSSFEELIVQAQPVFNRMRVVRWLCLITSSGISYEKIAAFIEPFLGHMDSPGLNSLYTWLKENPENDEVFAVVAKECGSNLRLRQVIELMFLNFVIPIF